MANLPGITVVIPAYNAETSLANAVNSVFTTGYEPIEILVVDDGSRDETPTIARSLEADNPKTIRIVTHSNNKNLGPGVSRNVGVEHASFDIVAFLDADDLYCTNRFLSAPTLLQKNPDVDAIVEPIRTQIEGRGEIRKGTVLDVVGFRCDEPDQLFYRAFGNPVETIAWGVSGITVRKEVFRKVGGFSENRLLPEDAVFRGKMLSDSRILSGQEEPVAIYRLHGDNISNSSLTPSDANYWVLVEVLAWIKSNGISRERFELVRSAAVEKGYFLCSKLFTVKNYRLARKILLDMVVRDPRLLTKRRYWANIAHASKFSSSGRIDP